MAEYIPKITSQKLDSLISREFDSDEIRLAKTILSGYTSESERGRNRVLAGVIKLSDGDLDRLSLNLDRANSDFRDIIAWAESPSLSKDPFGILHIKDKKRKQQILECDSNQYRNWLDRKVSSKTLRKILGVGFATSLRGRGISLSSALKEIEFEKYHSNVTVDDLRYQIDLMPEVIEEWFCYSEDKRTTGGWYLLRDLKIGTLMEKSKEISFERTNDAVANFVLKELGYWQGNSA